MKKLLFILLILPMFSTGQIVINPYVFGTSASVDYPLTDTINVAAAYGLVRTNEAYTGPLIRVVRSPEFTEQDIGYDGNGNLDTSALNTFLSGSNNYGVITLYDQSGNGKNATQSVDLAKTFKIELNAINGLPALKSIAPTSTSGTYMDIGSSTSYFNFLHANEGTVTIVSSIGTGAPNEYYALLGNNSGSSGTTGFSLYWNDVDGPSNTGGTNTFISKGASGQPVVNDIIESIIPPQTFTILQNLSDVSLSASLRNEVWVDNVQATSTTSAANAAVSSNATYDMQIGTYGRKPPVVRSS